MHLIGRTKQNPRSILALSSVVFSLMLVLLFSLNLLVSRARVEAADGEAFVDASAQIFTGRVVSSETFFSEVSGMIMTRHIFEVEDMIKGRRRFYVQITEHGGSEESLTSHGTQGVDYRPDQAYLVFSYYDQFGRGRTLAGSLVAIGDPRRGGVGRVVG